MFFYKIQVPKVTPAQIAAARQIIPSLEIQPVVTREEALRVATKKVQGELGRFEYISTRKLVLLPSDAGRPDVRAHFVKESEDGWEFELLIAGD